MKRVWAILTAAFLAHEIWALRMSLRFRLLSIFFFSTLLIWVITPASAFGAPITWLMVEGPAKLAMLGALAGLLFAITFLVIVTPWCFRWYFVCVGLFLGKTVTATRRLEHLLERKAAYA